MIKSLLDNDLYKLTMMQAVWAKFHKAQAVYEFKCRTKGVVWTKEQFEKLGENFACLQGLKATTAELDYLYETGLFKDEFIVFLHGFELGIESLGLGWDEKTGELDLSICGSWLDTILLEVPVLAIINQTYFQTKNNTEGISRMNAKIEMLEKLSDPTFKFVDFGTRRRYSREWQERIVKALKQFAPTNFVGTSNVKLAMDHNLPCVGTMAHEWIMAGQGMCCAPRLAQRVMLDKWAEVYKGKLGIALSDTLGTINFLKDFDGRLARMYDGMRQDSGDPYKWLEWVLFHYNTLGIDAKTKRAVFSDNLSIGTAHNIHQAVAGRIQDSYGIGTNLTNDCGPEPLNIVIKMTECNNHPVVKFSDVPTKAMGDDFQQQLMRKEYEYQTTLV
jgi:nicotinate phosphoribosyltransferase